MAVAVDYARDVKPYDDDPGDWTDAEIATNLGGETFGAIRIDAARTYHFDAAWWYKTGDAEYEGTFQTIRDDPGSPAIATDVLKRIWEIIFGASQKTYNTELRRKANGQIAEQQFGHYFRDFTAWAVAQGHITQESVNDFIAMASGWKYPTKPTAADITASRNAAVIDDGRQAAVNDAHERANAASRAADDAYGSGASAENITLASETAWDSWT